MLVSRLLRSLLRFSRPGIVPMTGRRHACACCPRAVETRLRPRRCGSRHLLLRPPRRHLRLPRPVRGLTKALDAAARPLPLPPPPPPAAPAARRRRAIRLAASQRLARPLRVPPRRLRLPTAAPGAPVPPAPKPGEIDLTPPEGMNERSQQRWAQLTERAKQVPELERRATEATQALDSVRQMVTSAAWRPTSSARCWRWPAGEVRQPAGRPARAADAGRLRTDLAHTLRHGRPGVDPLAAHADLKADVDGMLMTREDALEIARLRSGNQQGQQVMQSSGVPAVPEHRAERGGEHGTHAQAREGTPGHEAKVNYIGSTSRTRRTCRRS
jgi:hypothetical protein